MSAQRVDRRGIQVQRYVDGELDAVARQAFEARMADDPELAGAVAELASLRRLFAPERDQAGLRPDSRFRSRTLAACLAEADEGLERGGSELVGRRANAGPLPMSGRLIGASPAVGAVAAEVAEVQAAEAQLVSWARRAIYVAAALLLCAVILRSGLLDAGDPGQLQASSAEVERLMEELDARIAAGRAEGR